MCTTPCAFGCDLVYSGITKSLGKKGKTHKKARKSKKIREKKIRELECRKWGFKRWGFKQFRGHNIIMRAFFLRFPDFSGAVRALRKRVKKANFGRFPEREAGHPLNPHLLHPYLRHSNQKRLKNDFRSHPEVTRKVFF